MRKEVAQVACDQYKELLMGYLDNELTDEQNRRLQEHLDQCPQCAEELEQFKRIKVITDEVTLLEPEDRIWQDYWASVYNRIERGLGWILLSLAGIVLILYCGFRMIEQIVRDPQVGFILKAGLLLLIAALAVLLVSIGRERLYFWRSDRYRNVRR